MCFSDPVRLLERLTSSFSCGIGRENETQNSCLPEFPLFPSRVRNSHQTLESENSCCQHLIASQQINPKSRHPFGLSLRADIKGWDEKRPEKQTNSSKYPNKHLVGSSLCPYNMKNYVLVTHYFNRDFLPVEVAICCIVLRVIGLPTSC